MISLVARSMSPAVLVVYDLNLHADARHTSDLIHPVAEEYSS